MKKLIVGLTILSMFLGGLCLTEDAEARSRKRSHKSGRHISSERHGKKSHYKEKRSRSGHSKKRSHSRKRHSSY